MTQLETEIQLLKDEVKNMWVLVNSQLAKARASLLNFDKDLSREVILKEKRVNGSELKIDRDCENMFALYTPVAIDLRFLLAVLKINSNLERIGDIAEGIAKYVLSAQAPFTAELIEATRLADMYSDAMAMVEDSLRAFEHEDTGLARSVFKKDDALDVINKKANELVINYLDKYPRDLDAALYALSIIRKLERVGDQTKNIAEEIIFYLEAKVLKHSSKG
ncbi:MAG TPA: phosphate signaling complex protein PhoU [Chitinophagaceae bacterium]|nr:phosphate signaling complex protein PhoU [Chitinophagaceae bacterium]